ncbi:MAG: hypothetical protein GX801_04915 [Fibrobacter sp.]|nr:hypothetical protein [Fibrobacter sp.]
MNKVKYLLIICLSLKFSWAERLPGLPLGGPASTGPENVQSSQELLKISIDPSQPGIKMSLDGAFGADLAIWNKPDDYAEFKPFLIDAGFNWFRFPNGSLSNDYHWNGEGKFDENGVWATTHKEYKPGFLVESRFRGTSKDNYGFKRASHLTDGNDTTLWWGSIDDNVDLPWFVLDLGTVHAVDSVEIVWGKYRPKSFALAVWDSIDAVYPGPQQNHVNKWKNAFVGKATQERTQKKFTPISGRFWAVRVQKKHLPKQGLQVGQIRLWSQGEQVTRNVPDPGAQTRTWAMSTHIGGKVRADWIDIKWDFEKFMAWVQSVPQGQAVISVNVATGTPAEAANWVRYANKVRGFKIRDWQVGNENDGDWEEGGPLSATQYARRYIAFAKAMKAVDPSIRVYGPLHSTADWFTKGDGLYSGRSWMETFLKVVAEAEIKDKKRYLDGVDFHSYPYWFDKTGDAATMLHSTRRPGPMMDTLATWLRKHFKDGDKRRVAYSEYSSTVVGTHLTQQAVQGTAVLSLLADFAVRFGDRGHALPWDVYGGFQTGPDGTSGSLRLFNPVHPWAYSSWGNHSPSSQYHALYLAQTQWQRQGFAVLPVNNPDSMVRVFALGNKDSINVLLLNFRAEPVKVELNVPSSHSSPMQSFVFSETNFNWQGTDLKAYAAPGMGAWANRHAADSVLQIMLPPQGVALVQWGSIPLADEPVLMQHLAMTRNVLKPGDTIDIWGTVIQENGAVLGADYKSVWGPGEIFPSDGQWGGSMEGLRLQIPIPHNTKPGEHRLEITTRAAGDQVGAWLLKYRIQGEARTVAPLSLFDKGVTLQSDQPDQSEWFVYAHGRNGTKLDLKIIPGPPPMGGYLHGDFYILQPEGQGWPNFVSAHLPIERELFTKPEFGRLSGVIFDYATFHDSNDGYFQFMALSEPVKDYDDYIKLLRNTKGTWVRDTVFWEDMAQEGWGKPCGLLDPKLITQFEWQARGQGSGYMRIDNLMLLAEDGKEVPMPQGFRRTR